jgi:two-component system, chemotaxis family, protein-glutamate methylesterase/glutaminase
VHEPVRVLIVDDSAFMRRAVERMLSESPAIRVIGMAINGEEAVRLACELKPDAIVMDVNMPEMDGLQALQRIMERCPTPVLMMSTVTRAGAAVTLRALELGAVDFLDKSRAGTAMDIYQLGPQLRDKVITVARADVAPTPLATPPVSDPPVLPPSPSSQVRHVGRFDIIAIGASTGGPRALTEILPRLPANLEAGIVVAQHMPPGFTGTFAERLDDRCALRIAEATDGDRIEPGSALIAPGGKQMRVERQGNDLVVRVSPSIASMLHHPSVDVLFESVAAAAGARAVGVVLTGMGQDGAIGLRAMREAGARTFAESSDTAVIYGMPRAAQPAAERVLPLDRVAPALIELCAPPEGYVARRI